MKRAAYLTELNRDRIRKDRQETLWRWSPPVLLAALIVIGLVISR